MINPILMLTRQTDKAHIQVTYTPLEATFNIEIKTETKLLEKGIPAAHEPRFGLDELDRQSIEKEISTLLEMI